MLKGKSPRCPRGRKSCCKFVTHSAGGHLLECGVQVGGGSDRKLARAPEQDGGRHDFGVSGKGACVCV